MKDNEKVNELLTIEQMVTIFRKDLFWLVFSACMCALVVNQLIEVAGKFSAALLIRWFL